nr:immunoglobulin heavy chain junction region [Macaca mulatta]MOW75571.1 immunoglobulin heavy chain junction region [Macaca mulatta]MOW75879.1 immunoglobulin heavy chain junction region [Macaca mulatta]MOW76061.1 immunoglobulin heavy chain junction region [Macaca mulatta]MOW76121.1 immunoglobulin heavy chain junction region [Macaca mulatta]
CARVRGAAAGFFDFW